MSYFLPYPEARPTISRETVGNILRRHNIPPAPERDTSPSWRHLMTHYKNQLLACDFFTVETLLLQTLYVLVFFEIGSRRVHFAGCTAHPNNAWVTQQARQVMWALEDREPGIRFLIRDNDQKFSRAFDTVFRCEGLDVIATPYRAPNVNAFAERWIRSVREECLDKLLIINQAHLGCVMREYVEFFNTARPHQGIDQQIPYPKQAAEPMGRCAVAMFSVGSSTTTTKTLRRGKTWLVRRFLRVRGHTGNGVGANSAWNTGLATR